MSKLGAVFLTGLMLATTPLIAKPVSAAEVPHHITRSAAWGCRDKSDLVNLLFLGLSTSFDLQLAQALADGRCGYFTSGENVMILDQGGHGLVKVEAERAGAAPIVYWTPVRNVD